MFCSIGSLISILLLLIRIGWIISGICCGRWTGFGGVRGFGVMGVGAGVGCLRAGKGIRLYR